MDHTNHEEVARVLGAIRAIESFGGARPQLTSPAFAQSMVHGWPAALDAASMGHLSRPLPLPHALS